MSFGHVKHVWARMLEEEQKRERLGLGKVKIYICVNCKHTMSVFDFMDVTDLEEYAVRICGVECDQAVIEDVMDT